jgi:surface antigen
MPMMQKRPMKRFALTVVLLPAFAVAALAAMPPGARAALDRAIAEAVENARSGSEVPWSGGPGYGGQIVVEKAFSQATGEVCTNACNDPCRAVDYQVSTTDALTEFRGVRCRRVDDDGSMLWTIRGTDMVVRHMSMVKQQEAPPAAGTTGNPFIATVPPPAAHAASASGSRALKERKRLAVKIQQSLKHLLYYSGEIDGNFGSVSLGSLQAFLKDERSLLDATLSEDVLNLLDAAEQRIGRGTCPHPSGIKSSDTIACAMLSG